MPLVRILAGDAFDSRYRSERQMVEAVIGRIAIAAREDGWPGMKLADAEWTGSGFGKEITLTIDRADRGAVTVDDVGKFLRAKKREQKG